MTKQEQIMEFESHLMIGLFKATVEQTTQCTNKYNVLQIGNRFNVAYLLLPVVV
jgi:hypothetical protein